MFKSITSRTAVWLLFVPAVFALCTGSAVAGVIPTDVRINTDWSNVSALDGYDAVTQIGYGDLSDGETRFEDNGWVPIGWRIWFLDDGTKPSGWDNNITFLFGRQPVGVVDTDGSGLYNVDSTHAIQGDKNATTQVDEGATGGTFLTLAAEELATHKFYGASFTSGHMLTTGFVPFWEGEDTTHNILIDRTQLLPEPATLTLLAAGGAATVLLRRRRKM